MKNQDIQGKATTITSDQAKGGYAPVLNTTPPYLSTPPHSISFQVVHTKPFDGKAHVGSKNSFMSFAICPFWKIGVEA
jgi:hypothetical protein